MTPYRDTEDAIEREGGEEMAFDEEYDSRGESSRPLLAEGRGSGS